MEEAERHELLGYGGRAAEAIGQIAGDKDSHAAIATNAGSLRSVATVLDGLMEEVRRCGGGDCMGRSIDGLRLWVTQDRLVAERARVVTLEARLASIESSVHAIAEAAVPAMPDFAMLLDWQEVALRQQEIARTALRDSRSRTGEG